MTVLHLDLETRSVVDLTRCGLDNYSAHPSARVLMCGWAIDEEPPALWLPGRSAPPERLRRAFDDPAVLCAAWNAQFERVLLARVLKIDVPIARWRCSMVRAMMLALPGRLEECGRVLRLTGDFQKSAEGKRLIRLFCIPHKPTKAFPGDGIDDIVWYDETTHPLEWAQFCAYCLQDVVAERRIDKLLAKYPVPELEWRVYALDQKINDRGVPIDLVFCRNALAMFQRRKKEIAGQMNRATGLGNANSTGQLLPWVRERGYPFASLEKARVKKALADFEFNMTEECKAVLRMRLIAAKTSATKLSAMMRRVGKDGRLRFTLQMCGAGRTGRWCLAEGTQVTVSRAGVMREIAIETVADSDLLWDGEQWVGHGGVVFSGEKSVINYSGIWATPEHMVYISDTESVPLGVAARDSLKLWSGEAPSWPR